jgi:hypothetical protein
MNGFIESQYTGKNKSTIIFILRGQQLFKWKACPPLSGRKVLKRVKRELIIINIMLKIKE